MIHICFRTQKCAGHRPGISQTYKSRSVVFLILITETNFTRYKFVKENKDLLNKFEQKVLQEHTNSPSKWQRLGKYDS